MRRPSRGGVVVEGLIADNTGREQSSVLSPAQASRRRMPRDHVDASAPVLVEFDRFEVDGDWQAFTYVRRRQKDLVATGGVLLRFSRKLRQIDASRTRSEGWQPAAKLGAARRLPPGP